MNPQTKNDRKKEREQRYFHKVRELLPELWPVSAVENLSDESPDILIQVRGETCGIEVTEIVHKEVIGPEAHRKDVCIQAFRAANLGLNFRVDVHFRSVPLSEARERQEAARLLAEFVSGQAAVHDDKVTWNERINPRPDSPFGKYATAVFIHFIPARAHPVWRSSEAWSPKFLWSGRIEEAIAKKESLLSTYRVKARKIFLLIVADGFTASRSVQVQDEALAHTYRTGFDGVVLLDYGHNRAYVLTTDQPHFRCTP